MMSYKVKDAVGNIYIIKASDEKEAIKKFRTIKDSKFIGSDGTVDFYEYDNGYYVGGKRIADKKVKDYGTQRRQFRPQDIDEEGSWLGTTEWSTPKGAMYVYKKGNKIVADCHGVAYGDPQGIFEFDNLNQFNKWLLRFEDSKSVRDEKKFWDPEYDRIVTEDVIKKQFEHFKNMEFFNKSYEEFKKDNFEEITDKNREMFRGHGFQVDSKINDADNGNAIYVLNDVMDHLVKASVMMYNFSKKYNLDNAPYKAFTDGLEKTQNAVNFIIRGIDKVIHDDGSSVKDGNLKKN